jgi:ADP-ribosylglycohydrolase
MTNYAKKSLEGLWVGDCIGNLGQLYFAHDILKALEAGMEQYGSQLIPFHQQFMYSDDTEEAIVLYNHLQENKKIIQDKLAIEFATRYYTRDPDGEIYGYGLMTRKVLRDIYEGTHWTKANKTYRKIEGPSFVDKALGNIANGSSVKEAIHKLHNEIPVKKPDEQVLVGSCGNGSAMRVAPLGAFLSDNKNGDESMGYLGYAPSLNQLVIQAADQAQVTHEHPEGIAGSIAVTCLTYILTEIDKNPKLLSNGIDAIYQELLRIVPKGQVADGIERASKLPLDTPVGKAIEVLGNGSSVTCQDTVPLCIFLTLKGLLTYGISEMYEKTIIETSMAFGDVDTNCAIVGGMLGVIASPPQKWINFCKPMEGVL